MAQLKLEEALDLLRALLPLVPARLALNPAVEAARAAVVAHDAERGDMLGAWHGTNE